MAVLWAVVTLGLAMLILRPDSNGEVVNTASILAGRPIALTDRGRERVRLDHVTPEMRRYYSVVMWAGLALVAAALVAAILSR